ncbi:hypothetical protein VTK73DRAFT_6287 [Phialemonium thermophilum]|uniref:Uncharacterized protein n=1 Tax=Phialemonium thermophilum TaxID=223376 RepID=A0ABR3UZR3_9PEZI
MERLSRSTGHKGTLGVQSERRERKGGHGQDNPGASARQVAAEVAGRMGSEVVWAQ